MSEQQPTPQDINKWIEDEARKEEIYERKYGGKDHSGYDTKMLYEVNYERSECFEKGAKAMYQLLLPELQQLRDKVWALEGVVKHQESEIEQQKETIEELKKLFWTDDSLKQENERLFLGVTKLLKEKYLGIGDVATFKANCDEFWQSLKQKTHG